MAKTVRNRTVSFSSVSNAMHAHITYHYVVSRLQCPCWLWTRWKKWIVDDTLLLHDLCVRLKR